MKYRISLLDGDKINTYTVRTNDLSSAMDMLLEDNPGSTIYGFERLSRARKKRDYSLLRQWSAEVVIFTFVYFAGFITGALTTLMGR